MPKIFVTGVTGFIGSEVAREVVKDDQNVLLKDGKDEWASSSPKRIDTRIRL